MKRCRFDGTIMRETKLERLKIIEYECPECGHYWYRKIKS